MIPIKDIIPRRQTPFVTYFLILLNTLIFFIEISIPHTLLNSIFYIFGLVPARYTHPEWAYIVGLHIDNYWPFFTNIFLHGSWFHLICNMWALWIFGDNVEDRMGHISYLIFYLLCGIVASFTYFVFNPNSTIPAIGASGAIAGIMGAYFILFPHSRIITLIPLFFIPYFIEIPAVIFIGFWFIFQLISGTFSIFAGQHAGGIAWWAHVGGFIFGLVTHKFFIRSKYYREFYPDEYFFKFLE